MGESEQSMGALTRDRIDSFWPDGLSAAEGGAMAFGDDSFFGLQALAGSAT